ncbi:MAG TPA: ABC transporter ATP-binding protein [bacterium]|nr:ABC transporter ATP-binding protein [bacterium]
MDKVVEIKNLSYTYPDGTPALDGVTLDVMEGESVGIIGPNGAGKSTLLLHLNGILQSKNGAIKVLGMPLINRNLRKIRSKACLVFQDPEDQLFMPTVFDDVAFGLINLGYDGGAVKEKVEDILERVDLSGRENRSSHHLSFGEKKLVSLATVLVMEPEILLLDEPTSNLDRKEKREIIKFLQKIDKTKIIVSHDLEMIKQLCQRVAVINRGKVVFAGDKEILKDDSRLKSFGL